MEEKAQNKTTEEKERKRRKEEEEETDKNTQTDQRFENEGVFFCKVRRSCQTESKHHQAVALCLPLLRTSVGDSVLEQLRRRREGIDLWPYVSQPAAGPQS